MDLTPGKEGGTWLGASRIGKIGALLNLDRNEHGFEENKSGRGCLEFALYFASLFVFSYSSS